MAHCSKIKSSFSLNSEAIEFYDECLKSGPFFFLNPRPIFNIVAVY